MRTVDTLIGALLQAGFEGATAARLYRAIGDFSLSWAAWEATFLALGSRAQDNDRAAWARAYRSAGRAGHPHIWQLREALPEVTDDDVFDTVLSLLVGGLLRIAPQPCSCHPRQ
jgi:hypothetical protein